MGICRPHAAAGLCSGLPAAATLSSSSVKLLLTGSASAAGQHRLLHVQPGAQPAHLQLHPSSPADLGDAVLTTQGSCLQAWARLEAKRGNLNKARQLFRLGADCDPTHTYIWQAWGVMEFNAGDLDRARELFQEVSFGFSLIFWGSCWLSGSRLGVLKVGA